MFEEDPTVAIQLQQIRLRLIESCSVITKLFKQLSQNSCDEQVLDSAEACINAHQSAHQQVRQISGVCEGTYCLEHSVSNKIDTTKWSEFHMMRSILVGTFAFICD